MADIDTQVQELIAGLQDYDVNVDKYKDRLSPYSYQAPKMSFFDLASDLGAGILSTPNTGRAALYTGLSAGFTQASERLKKREEDTAKARQAVGLEAARLAMQDEQKAAEYLNDYATRVIGDSNKEIKTMNLSWLDPDTKERKEGTLDKSSDLFKDIMSDPESYEAKEVTQPLVDMSTNEDMYKDINKATADLIVSQEEEWSKDSDAQFGILDKTNAARYFANQLTEQDFGPLAVWSLGVKGVMVGLNLGNFIDEDKLGTQTAVNSVGTGLAMGLISQTKGAISDREMGMFLKASATLGNSKSGFLKILSITDKIAKKSVVFNEAWSKERAALMKKGMSIADIRAEMNTFKRRYHEANPLFEGSESYNASLSIPQNLKNMKDAGAEGTEAYMLVAQMTEEGEALYKNLSQKHATIKNPNTTPKEVSKDITGVPDGAVEVGVFLNPNDANDPRNGKKMYRKDGKVYVKDEEQ
jgi:hypothetical protein|tara:strand:- start:1093 stop:2505 length:1413 start_codon:yes stop_codon:yes gene_type:complete